MVTAKILYTYGQVLCTRCGWSLVVLKHALESPGGCATTQIIGPQPISDSTDMGWGGLRICISNTFPGDTDYWGASCDSHFLRITVEGPQPPLCRWEDWLIVDISSTHTLQGQVPEAWLEPGPAQLQFHILSITSCYLEIEMLHKFRRKEDCGMLKEGSLKEKGVEWV